MRFSEVVAQVDTADPPTPDAGLARLVVDACQQEANAKELLAEGVLPNIKKCRADVRREIDRAARERREEQIAQAARAAQEAAEAEREHRRQETLAQAERDAQERREHLLTEAREQAERDRLAREEAAAAQQPEEDVEAEDDEEVLAAERAAEERLIAEAEATARDEHERLVAEAERKIKADEAKAASGNVAGGKQPERAHMTQVNARIRKPTADLTLGDLELNSSWQKSCIKDFNAKTAAAKMLIKQNDEILARHPGAPRNTMLRELGETYGTENFVG